MAKRIVMGITGASGAIYAVRLLRMLLAHGCEVHLAVSPLGRRLLADELDILQPTAEGLAGSESPERLVVHNWNDVGAVIASGSFLTEGMVICPCSSNTLGAIAAGLGDNLITRAAQVTLKEARRLVLVPREMPLSPIEAENLARLTRAGVVVCPASPGFYLRPTTIEELVDFVVGKVLDLLGIEHNLNTRYQDPHKSQST